jgi:hypothetical protein
MECLRCHRENDPKANYCGNCGTRILNDCPNCGEKNIANSKFCPKCGVHLKLLFLTMAMDDHRDIKALDDLDLQAELELYKREVGSGSAIITCSHCGVKNRVPMEKKRQKARCGKCGKPLIS